MTIAPGADCVVGSDNGGLLSGLTSLAPAPSKIIQYDSAGLPTLADWIIGGSFTPTISCASPGDFAPIITTASGKFNKRGRKVEVIIVLVFTPNNYATAAGNIRIGGLPYVADGETALALLNFSSLSGFAWPGTSTQIFAAVQANQNYAHLIGHKSGSSTQTADISTFPGGASPPQQTLRITGEYRSAA